MNTAEQTASAPNGTTTASNGPAPIAVNAKELQYREFRFPIPHAFFEEEEGLIERTAEESKRVE